MDSDDEQQKSFVGNFFQNNLQQHFVFFTRGTSFLNLAITSEKGKIGDVSKLTRKVSLKSDHVPINCNKFLSQDNFLYRKSSRLSFSFCHKAMIIIMMVKRNLQSTTMECQNKLYKSTILPILSSGSPCLAPHVEPLKRFGRVQKHATTWMVGSKDYKVSY